MGTWTNSDGLYVRFGPTEITPTKGGEWPAAGLYREVNFEINLVGLTTSEVILNEGVMLPAGVRIQEVVLRNKTAATTGDSATLDVGLIRTDRSTTYDDDGLCAAVVATTIDAAGEQVTYTEGTTGHGVLIGTTLAYDGYITASVNTGTFSTGVLVGTVRFYVP